MKGCSSEYGKKRHPQKSLVEFDKKLETQFKGTEDAMFDRETRYATLRSEEYHPPSGTLFAAIFKEMRRKEEHESRKHSLRAIISRLLARRAKMQLKLQNA